MKQYNSDLMNFLVSHRIVLEFLKLYRFIYVNFGIFLEKGDFGI